MKIHRISCIGAGLIGQGWATLFSSKGYEVTLMDLDEKILQDALSKIESNLKFLENQGLLENGATKSSLSRIKLSTNLVSAVSRSDYVQESVPDQYEVKKEVFKEIDTYAPSHTILASSSSGLLMSEIQKVTKRPERCVLTHPVLPVHLIPVVEIAGGEKTSLETMNTIYEFMKSIGKVPILLKRETPGYIINRLQAALLREAIDLVDKGIADVEDIDKAFCMGIGLRDPLIGPFLRIHLAGGGIEKFIEKYSRSYQYRWETMETWTSIPSSAIQKIVEGVKKMNLIREKSLDEISEWRDRMLVKLLKFIDQEKI
jgi:3-hydroxypropionate dehydrogenase (NADP+)